MDLEAEIEKVVPVVDHVEDPVEDLVTMIHQMKDMQKICKQVTDPEIRLRLRDALGEGLPDLERYKVAEDKFFLLFLNALRMNYDGRDDYTDRIRQMAVVLQGARTGVMEAVAPAVAPKAIPSSPPVTPAPVSVTPQASPRVSPLSPASVASRPDNAPRLHVVPGAPTASAVALFEARPPEHAGYLPALLGPPPAKGSSGKSMSNWLSGVPAGPACVAIRLDGHGVAEQLAECEAELRSDPDRFLSRSGIRPRMKPGERVNGADWMKGLATWMHTEAGNPVEGVPPRESDALPVPGVLDLRNALERVIDRIDPAMAGRLKGAGARLVIPDAAARLVAVANGLENLYLEELCDNTGDREPQNHLGAMSDRGALTRGCVLERAATCHFIIGLPLDGALTLALLELRCAQALRLAGPENEDSVFQSFDDRFFADCRQPLSGYMIADEDPIPEP